MRAIKLSKNKVLIKKQHNTRKYRLLWRERSLENLVQKISWHRFSVRLTFVFNWDDPHKEIRNSYVSILSTAHLCLDFLRSFGLGKALSV